MGERHEGRGRAAVGRRRRRAVGMAVAAVLLVLTASGCVLNGEWTDVGLTPAGEQPASILDISCPEVDVCFAVGYLGSPEPVLQIQQWDGASWTSLTGVPEAPPSTDGWATGASISCWSTTGCLVLAEIYASVDTYNLVYEWDGTTFTDTGLTYQYASDVDCWGPDGCTVYTFPGERLVRWDGSTWAAIPELQLLSASWPGACVDATTCVVPAQGENAVHHLEGGVVTSEPAPFEVGEIACATSDACHAVSTDRRRLAEWDGVAWTERTLLQPDGQVLDVRRLDCASPTACVATAFRTVDGGPSEAVALGWWGDDAWGRIAAPASWVDSPIAWRNPVIDCVAGESWCIALARTGPAATDATASIYDWS